MRSTSLEPQTVDCELVAIDGHHGHPHDHHEERAELVSLGFWLYVISDCLLFATLFASHAVMGQNYAGGVRPQEVFMVGFLAGQTALLLLSSFTFGMAMLSAYVNDLLKTKLWLGLTATLAIAFLAMEIYEFLHLAHLGATPQTSGYWSSFYALVATHGIHVFVGLVWMGVLIFHFNRDGFSHDNMMRLSCLSVFWHFLDIVWICVFSFVYLKGAIII